MRLLARHFYSEQVFDDSTSDQPRLRWRYRNSYSDGVAYGQQTHETDVHSGRSQQLHDYDFNRNMGKNSYGNPENDSKTNSVDFPSDSDIERAIELKRNSLSKATGLFSQVLFYRLFLSVIFNSLRHNPFTVKKDSLMHISFDYRKSLSIKLV